MDVYNSIIAHSATHPHVVRSLNFIIEQIRLYTTKGLALSFNGGKDCTVLLHLLRAAFAKVSGLSGLDGLACLYFLIPDEFEEVTQFMEQTSKAYNFRIVNLEGSFRSALTSLLTQYPIKAIFMGQRRDDPGATPQEVAKSDPGWPEFYRLNPILDWTYTQVWEFLRMYRLPYCSLYDHGYTSLGSKSTTCRNPALQRADGTFAPAFELTDGSKERIGRYKPPVAVTSPRAGSGLSTDVPCTNPCTCTSSLPSAPSCPPAASSSSSTSTTSSSSSSTTSSTCPRRWSSTSAAASSTCPSSSSSSSSLSCSSPPPTSLAAHTFSSELYYCPSSSSGGVSTVASMPASSPSSSLHVVPPPALPTPTTVPAAGLPPRAVGKL